MRLRARPADAGSALAFPSCQSFALAAQISFLRTIGLFQRRHQVMHNRPRTYVVAIAIGAVALYLKNAFPDLNWLSWGLFSLAFLLALLATSSFAYDKGRHGNVASLLSNSRPQTPMKVEMKPSADRSRSQVPPRVQVPRPAGPAGPAPVLEKRPKSTIVTEPNNPKVPEN